MEHSHRVHLANVNALCRTCGNRSQTRREKDFQKKPILCGNYTESVFFVFNVNVEKDQQGSHSNTICKKCVKILHNVKQTKSEERRNLAIKRSNESSNIWTRYDGNVTIDDCSVCSHYNSFNSGGKKKVSKKDVTPDLPKVTQISCNDKSEAFTSDINYCYDTQKDHSTSVMESSCYETLQQDNPAVPTINDSQSDHSLFLTNNSSSGAHTYRHYYSEISAFYDQTTCAMETEEDNTRELMNLARAIAGDFSTTERVNDDVQENTPITSSSINLPIACSTPIKTRQRLLIEKAGFIS